MTTEDTRTLVLLTEPEYRIMWEALNSFNGHLTRQYAEIHQWEGPDVIRLSGERECAERLDMYGKALARLNFQIEPDQAIVTESQAGESTK